MSALPPRHAAAHHSYKPLRRQPTIKSPKGQNAVAHVAYILREKIRDEASGEIKGLKTAHEKDLRHAEVVGWSGDAASLANAAEAAENRINSRVGYSTVLAIPNELSHDRQEALVRGYALWLRDRYGVAVITAIHDGKAAAESERKRGKKTDSEEKINQANDHAHLYITARRVEKDAAGREFLGAKVRELGGREKDKGEVEARRAEWARRCNAELAKIGVEARVDHRSHKRRADETGEPVPAPIEHQGPARNAERAKIEAAEKAAKEGKGPAPKVPAWLKRQRKNEGINSLLKETSDLVADLAETKKLQLQTDAWEAEMFDSVLEALRRSARGGRGRANGRTDFPDRIEWRKNRKLHRIGAPAVLRKEKGKPAGFYGEDWFRDGLLDRDDGPAVARRYRRILMKTDAAGNVIGEASAEEQKRDDRRRETREDRPLREVQWWSRGKPGRKSDGLMRVRYSQFEPWQPIGETWRVKTPHGELIRHIDFHSRRYGIWYNQERMAMSGPWSERWTTLDGKKEVAVSDEIRAAHNKIRLAGLPSLDAEVRKTIEAGHMGPFIQRRTNPLTGEIRETPFTTGTAYRDPFTTPPAQPLAVQPDPVAELRDAAEARREQAAPQHGGRREPDDERGAILADTQARPQPDLAADPVPEQPSAPPPAPRPSVPVRAIEEEDDPLFEDYDAGEEKRPQAKPGPAGTGASAGSMGSAPAPVPAPIEGTSPKKTAEPLSPEEEEKKRKRQEYFRNRGTRLR